MANVPGWCNVPGLFGISSGFLYGKTHLCSPFFLSACCQPSSSPVALASSLLQSWLPREAVGEISYVGPRMPEIWYALYIPHA